MTVTSNTLASAGTANLYAGSAARIFAAWGPRIALAPDVPGAAAVPDMSDLSDAELGLGDDAAQDETEEQRAGAEAQPAGDEGAEAKEPGEGEREEGEDPAEGEPEEESDAEGDQKSPDDGVKVKLDDGQEVPLGELKKGYLRQADYTRKTQALARDNDAMTAATTRLVEFDKQTKASMQIAAQVIEAYTPKAPDIALLNQGPDGVSQFMMQKELFDRGQALLQDIHGRIQQQGHGAQQLSDANLGDLVARETAQLIEKRPDWRDPKKREAALSEMTALAQSEYGFSLKDLQGVTDHRAINVLADAVAYRKLKSQRSEAISKVQRTPPMRTAPRQAPQQRQQAGQAQAIARARRLGTEEAVAATFTDADLGL